MVIYKISIEKCESKSFFAKKKKKKKKKEEMS